MIEKLRGASARFNAKFYMLIGPMLLVTVITFGRSRVGWLCAGLLCALVVNKGVDIVRKL